MEVSGKAHSITVNLVLLRLYITGQTARSKAAVQRLTELCASYSKEAVRFEVIDVLEHPDLAEGDRVLATPTLIRLMPLPSLRVVGDMSDREVVRRLLEPNTTSMLVM